MTFQPVRCRCRRGPICICADYVSAVQQALDRSECDQCSAGNHELACVPGCDEDRHATECPNSIFNNTLPRTEAGIEKED